MSAVQSEWEDTRDTKGMWHKKDESYKIKSSHTKKAKNGNIQTYPITKTLFTKFYKWVPIAFGFASRLSKRQGEASGGRSPL